MLDQIFNTSTMDYLSRGMSAANLRHEVISNNIANVNTPKFKKSDVVFESLLAKEMGLDKKLGLEMVRTHDRHLPIPMRERAEATVVMDESTTMRTDKNNVDIDTENVELASEQLRYQQLTTAVSNEFSHLKIAIGS
jgi:flagellar basal-body rod protein FlgB